MSGNLLPAIWRSARVTLRVWWRLTRQLFHEATGALFAVFAAYGAFVAWRQWKYHPPQWQWIIGVAIVYAIMMAAFALGAFRRARRVR
jgi:glycerol uptake facilitator-like aquaporin